MSIHREGLTPQCQWQIGTTISFIQGSQVWKETANIRRFRHRQRKYSLGWIVLWGNSIDENLMVAWCYSLYKWKVVFQENPWLMKKQPFSYVTPFLSEWSYLTWLILNFRVKEGMKLKNATLLFSSVLMHKKNHISEFSTKYIELTIAKFKIFTKEQVLETQETCAKLKILKKRQKLYTYIIVKSFSRNLVHCNEIYIYLFL